MPTKLKNLTINRVDLVDLGANLDPETGEGAHIMLFKAADDFRWASRPPEAEPQLLAETYVATVEKAGNALTETGDPDGARAAFERVLDSPQARYLSNDGPYLAPLARARVLAIDAIRSP